MDENPLILTEDPGARDLAAKLRAHSNRPVLKKFSVDGETIIVAMNGVNVEMPLEMADLEPTPVGFTDTHKDVMGMVYTAVQQIKEKGRVVPLTRTELLGDFKADPKVVAQLEKWDYLKQRIIMLHKATGKKAGARAIYYFTAQGRAYVRAEFDPEYGRGPEGGEAAAAGDSAGLPEGSEGTHQEAEGGRPDA